jgi:hypothetical protein
LSISGCSIEKIEQVDVYEMESFSKVNKDLYASFSDSKDVNVFVIAFKKVNKKPGIFDVSDPQYKVVLGEESYYLWINATYGSIMYENDSYTLYTLSKRSAKKIYDLLEK